MIKTPITYHKCNGLESKQYHHLDYFIVIISIEEHICSTNEVLENLELGRRKLLALAISSGVRLVMANHTLCC